VKRQLLLPMLLQEVVPMLLTAGQPLFDAGGLEL
jgi:hypothetical protein